MNTVVTTKKGKIRGVPMDGYVLFRGIPYAKPPVGELRWRAPQEADAWDGAYAADRFSCKAEQEEQRDGFYKKEFYENEAFEVPCDEDCLYLNIWMPSEAVNTVSSSADYSAVDSAAADGAKKRLPVAFWIHGGAFMGGYGSELEFDGEAYAKRGVILVTVNYRLNVYGFLAHPWLGAENGRGISGNYGTLDQIAALRWVYENIACFGGDPENITVFGQSAGAMSVQTLASSGLTDGMIAKAILQSGGSYGAGLHRDMPLAEAEAYGQRFVEMTGAKSLKELRGMSPEELAGPLGKMTGEMFTSGKGLVFVPNIDGYVLTQGYYETIDQNQIRDIPYLIGSTKNDITVTQEELRAGRRGMLYDGCLAFSHRLEELQGRPSYIYYFTRQMPGDDAGAFHSSELWYMFGTYPRCWRPLVPADAELSGRMLDYWTNFMKTGDPNGEGLPEWRACRREDAFVMELDI